jgi:hypothetical protein
MKKFALGIMMLTMTLSAEKSGDFKDTSQEQGLDLVAKASKPDKKMKKKKGSEEKKSSITCDTYESTQGLFVFGECLYWKAQSTRMPIGVVNRLAPGGTGSVVPIAAKTVDPRYGYEVGYRVGAGYRIPYRGWDVLGSWTHFQTTGKRRIDAKDDVDVSAIWFDENAFTINPDGMTGKNRIHFDTFDFELGKLIHFVPSFGLRPFIGFKMAWIKEHYSVDYPNHNISSADGGAGFIKMYNDFQGVGLRMGVNTDWEMDKGFAVLAKAVYSILWGNLDKKREEIAMTQNSHGTNLFYDYTFPEHHHVMISACELFAGARWEICYNQKKRFRFRIQGGYEAQFWPGFNQFTGLNSATQGSVVFPFTGDLGFHGWTVGTRFDF